MTAVLMQRNVQHLEQSANARIAKEQQALIAEIGEFMLLPADEVPTIATVTNKQKLRNQPIFADAENGDTLIAYPIAGKLILYRETQKQIITIASIHE